MLPLPHTTAVMLPSLQHGGLRSEGTAAGVVLAKHQGLRALPTNFQALLTDRTACCLC